MSKTYLYERQTEYWTSRGIEDYYSDAGYEILTFPISMVTENKVPFDFIFYEAKSCKLFGIQYKALYHNKHDYWPLNSEQHDKLQRYKDWAYYGLSEMKSSRDHKTAIHRALFVPVAIDFEPRIYTGKLDSLYYRWGGFINGLERCTNGRKVLNRQQLEDALMPIKDECYNKQTTKDMVDIFVANFETRRLLHFEGR